MAKVPKKPGVTKGAFNGGDYLGTPGKDIYFFLPKLNDKQFSILVNKHSDQYPFKAPNNHVGYAACIRYIYGQFDKQGILRSKGDLKRMLNEDLNWKLPRKFVFSLRDKLEEKNNHYGMCLLYEMEAHRVGDEVVLEKNNDKKKKMEETYMKSVEHAKLCGSLKQMFTPYFWAFKYYAQFGDHTDARRLVIRTLKQMEEFCPSAKQGYLVKAEDCAKYLKKYHSKEWKRIHRYYKKNSKNDCIKKMVTKIKG